MAGESPNGLVTLLYFSESDRCLIKLKKSWITKTETNKLVFFFSIQADMLSFSRILIHHQMYETCRRSAMRNRFMQTLLPLNWFGSVPVCKGQENEEGAKDRESIFAGNGNLLEEYEGKGSWSLGRALTKFNNGWNELCYSRRDIKGALIFRSCCTQVYLSVWIYLSINYASKQQPDW